MNGKIPTKIGYYWAYFNDYHGWEVVYFDGTDWMCVSRTGENELYELSDVQEWGSRITPPNEIVPQHGVDIP